MKRALFILLVTATLCDAAPVTLIGRDLSPQQVNLQSVRNNVVTYFDQNRAYQNERITKFLQLRFARDAQPHPTDGAVLQLIDGQQYRGKWIGSAADGEAIRWRHDVLGEVIARLDQIRAIRPAASGAPDQIPTSDRVTLANGDVMNGFVVAASADGLMMQVEGQRDTVTLPRDRIDRVVLANPQASSERQAHLVHLADGSRVRAGSVTIEGTKLRLDDQAKTSIDLIDVTRIDVAAEGARLVELADLPMTTTAGGEVFGMPMPPRVEAGRLFMHAPVTVRFDLPAGAVRCGAVAELDAHDAQPVQWADFVVRVRAGDEEYSCRISSDEPSARINLLLGEGAASLTIEVDAGVNGPVMDRLRLRDAVVLIEQSP